MEKLVQVLWYIYSFLAGMAVMLCICYAIMERRECLGVAMRRLAAPAVKRLIEAAEELEKEMADPVPPEDKVPPSIRKVLGK